MTTIDFYFGDLPDPRVDRCKHHNLLNIVTIAVCAVISNADGWTDIEAYGQAKEAWLRQFLELPADIHGRARYNPFICAPPHHY
jgi:hypothetical protein